MGVKKISCTVFVIIMTAILMFSGILISGCNVQAGHGGSVTGGIKEEEEAVETGYETANITAAAAAGSLAAGEQILPADLQPAAGTNRPVAVMVENSFAARPQSGLILADVVYEVVDEYGITRFVAIFSSNEAPMVGPVRSTRPYYAEIARSFNPIYAFFGTYPECYGYVQQLGLQVLSAMTDYSGNSSITGQAPYWRDWTRSSIQEHTAFMSVASLKQKAAALGYSLDGGIPFPYKADPPLEARGGIANINVSFATHAYAPRGFDLKYVYDRNNNCYLRYMGGSPHMDFNLGQQITAKNIVVMVSDITGPLDGYGHMAVRTTGSGTAFIFQDGNAIQGSWERGDVYSPFIYKDGSGRQISFTAGSTWIAIVQGADKVSFGG
ncbi:MAG: DUF3048 domain-containing protein [Actinobacteria bacterium]|nr:DUF3048 domain-containing protein [Actinomycetota bacterium]